MTRLAILGFGGSLPGRIALAHPEALFVTFGEMTAPPPAGIEVAEASIGRWGALFRSLRAANVTELVLAGSMARPKLNLARLDATTLGLAPRLLSAMKQGDDALLRVVISVFEREGFVVRGAHELVPELTVPAGLVCGRMPTSAEQADIDRGAMILAALGPLDVGQGVVVAGGLCLGIETLQGTDALLRFVAQTPQTLRPAQGILLKAPKAGQDLRVDMPTIGPRTVAAAQAAGVAGLALSAGQVLVLERETTLAAARDAGIFIVARAL